MGFHLLSEVLIIQVLNKQSKTIKALEFDDTSQEHQILHSTSCSDKKHLGNIYLIVINKLGIYIYLLK